MWVPLAVGINQSINEGVLLKRVLFEEDLLLLLKTVLEGPGNDIIGSNGATVTVEVKPTDKVNRSVGYRVFGGREPMTLNTKEMNAEAI